MIANEVLDVVPFSLACRQGTELFERGVILTDAGFAWDDQPMPDGDLRRRVEAVFPPGDYDYLSEVGLAAEGLVRTLAAGLDAGVALFIDYGFPEREFYHPQRSMGTLRCHYRHHFQGDPFFMPGLQDITAHVDFSAMARAAQQGGAEVHGFTTQAYFLISCGLAVHGLRGRSHDDALAPQGHQRRASPDQPGGDGRALQGARHRQGRGLPAAGLPVGAAPVALKRG